MIHIGLFEGVGGFSLAASQMGWETMVTCEIADFPNKVLQYHFPNAYHHRDIKDLTYATIDIELTKRFGNWRTDDIVITGGFPCQPFSVAGKRKGTDDDRFLWPEMLRIIREANPKWIVAENVPGLLTQQSGLVFEQVCIEMENEGYEVQAFIIPACAVNAPHRRDRIWIVAYSNAARQQRNEWQKEVESNVITDTYSPGRRQFNTPDFAAKPGQRDWDGNTGTTTRTESGWCGRLSDKSEKTGPQKSHELFGGSDWQDFPTQSPVRSGNDGFSDTLDGIAFSKWRNESIKAMGNAIVPQVALEIFKSIKNQYHVHQKQSLPN